jgi:hypothetical protein
MCYSIDISNPLIQFDAAELEAYVTRFAHKYGLMHILALLIRGAKVARDPKAYKSVPGLTGEEETALARAEGLGFWSQTKELRASVFTCAIAAILQYVQKL